MTTQSGPALPAESVQRENKQDRLITALDIILAPLGYEVVHVEIQSARQKVLRIFIDLLEPQPGQAVGIEDCVKATRALDEPLNALPEMEELFTGPYELEVSSPGVDRPLRKQKDFDKFSGREIRVHVFRPLTAEELGNPGYQQKNPKQKNFLGTLKGLKNDRIVLAISNQQGVEKGQKGKKGKKAKASSPVPNTNSVEEITIPLPLISKANLEPDFGLEGMDERE